MRGVKLVDLARAAGISHSYLSEVEQGKKMPSLKTLRNLCAALGISLAEFFAPEAEREPGIPPSLQRLLDKAKLLSPEELAALEQLLDVWARRPGKT